ncbi:hypothetical protein DFH08DRAFT_816421 [Mycena albidolilacea]|uniref:Uncharacterized protein n=1 Tax=Mycena albidolilacea TaxID=1033008 RepID=A0AAD6ZKF0_9AGAR|nr:hypothetical protein DFH08DRAFT_816421 [Mycena albidolilacea]
MVTAFHFFIAALAAGSVSGNSMTGFDSQQGQDIHGAAAEEQDQANAATATGNSTIGFDVQQGKDDQGAAADEQDHWAAAAAATKASVAEVAASISISAPIATASSSAAAAAATQIVNPLDPFPPDTHGLTPEQGQLAGLKAKLAVDT